MIPILVNLLILILVFGLIWWLITQIIPVPPQFLWIVQVILVVILILCLIDLLAGFSGVWWRYPVVR